jgi:hypothetical protein
MNASVWKTDRRAPGSAYAQSVTAGAAGGELGVHVVPPSMEVKIATPQASSFEAASSTSGSVGDAATVDSAWTPTRRDTSTCGSPTAAAAKSGARSTCR